jgi:hypothetical protein
MNSEAATPWARLTSKQRNVVRAYALQGMRQADAYRASYHSLGSPRTISTQAHRLMKTPKAPKGHPEIKRVGDDVGDTVGAPGVVCGRETRSAFIRGRRRQCDCNQGCREASVACSSNV